MEEVFFSNPNDKGLSIILKREANIVLASLDKNSPDYLYKEERFEETLKVIKSIENTEPQHEEEIQFILDTINRIWDTGILAPLTLEDDEFSTDADSNGYKHNLRYHDIYKDIKLNDAICNGNAFNLYVRAVYSHEKNEQLKHNNYTLEGNHRIYISKGGIITGEYIEKCIIRQEIVDKHCFTIQSIVNIPVCAIGINNFMIYCVDHREPKLKVLQQFYEIPIYKDDNVANKSCNIRKYKKLK